MKLRDTFMFDEPARQPTVRMPLGQMKEALAGIGNREMRTAQDYLWSMGVDAMPGEPGGWRPCIGEAVEFVLPNGDGMRRAGHVYAFQGVDAIVQVNAGEYNIVPPQCLMPRTPEARREERRVAVREALQGGSGFGSLEETRSLAPMGSGGTDFAMTLSYRTGMKPSDEDVRLYVEARYPGARVVDGDDRYPGRLGVVLSFPNPEWAAHAVRVSRGVEGQLAGPSSPPSDRMNATGIGSEEMEGTGKIGDSDGGDGGDQRGPTPSSPVISSEKQAMLDASGAALQALAARYPNCDFHETSIEDVGFGLVSHFEVTQNGHRLFVRSGALTQVLAADASPAIGTITASMDGVAIRLAQHDVPYAAGQGPLSAHENEPGANESGSYVVTADGMEQEGAGIPYNQMDYRREKERFDAQQAEQAQAEQRAKQRRLQQRPQGQGQGLPQGPGAPAMAPYTGEHLGGPGLNVAHVDAPTEEYYEDYYGEYGKQLTKDVAAARVGEIRIAWAAAGRGEPTARELLVVLGVLAEPTGRVAQTNDLIQSLMQSRQMDPSAGKSLDKMVIDFLARTPGALDTLGPNAFQQLLTGVVSDMGRQNPKALESLRMKYAPETDPVDTSGGRPGLMQRLKQKLSPTERAVSDSERLMGVPDAKSLEQSFGVPPSQQAKPPLPSQPAAPPQPALPNQPAGEDPFAQGLEFNEPAGAPPAAKPKGPKAPGGRLPAFPKNPRIPKMPPPGQSPPAGGGYVQIPKGARVFDVAGKPVQIPRPTEGQVIHKEGPYTIVRTREGQVLRMGEGEPSPRVSALMKQADSASENYAGRRQPAYNQLCFRMEGLSRLGDYLVMTVVWDADATRSMAPASVVSALKRFISEQSSNKEFIDIGWTGNPRIENCDLQTGLAEVKFRSSESRNGPPVVITREEAPYHELA